MPAQPGRMAEAGPITLLVNPMAAGGRALEALPGVRGELERLGTHARVVETRDVEHARSEAAAAADAGDIVAAFGGDGLVGTLAGVLRGTGTPLAILPCGRGNDFARVLGIPRDPRAAARVAVRGERRLVDVALADGVPYVGIASFGFDSEANRIANEAKLVRGNLVYLYAALRALARWRPAEFDVEIDGVHERFRGFSAGVGNSKAYGGGMYALPNAELDDGELDFCARVGESKLGFLWDLPKLFKGSQVDDPEFQFRRGRQVRVHADRPFVVYADGDPIGELPMTITIEEHALKVIVPGREEPA